MYICKSLPSTRTIHGMESFIHYLGGALALLIFLCYIQWKRILFKKTRSAPEPDGAWPFVGHLHQLATPQILHKTLGDMADKYGPAIIIRLGVHKALVVSSWEVARECFTTNDKAFATRPSSVAVKIMAYDSATFGFGPYAPFWREARKIAIQELLSNQRLELLKHIRISEVNTSINDLFHIWQASCSNSTKFVSVEMKQWFGDLSLNVVVRMVAGKRYYGATAKLDSDNDEGRRLQKAIGDFFHLVGLFVVSDALPLLGWLDIQGHKKAMRRTAKEMDCILGKWLEEHKQNISTNEAKAEPDFMDALLSIIGVEKLYNYDADTAVKGICMNMLVGGTDTTVITLTWALSLLLNNPLTLTKAQNEIDTIVGKDRLVEESDVEKLVYIQAIVKETLRLYPAAPLSAQHEAMEDCTVSGYHIPAGTRLITNLWKIQQDSRVWSNPSEFQPERFLTTQASVEPRGQHFEFIPFGSGRRSCPGISLALQVAHLAIARFLQGFDCRTPTNALVDMTESAGLTNIKATPLEVLITPRLSPDLY